MGKGQPRPATSLFDWENSKGAERGVTNGLRNASFFLNFRETLAKVTVTCGRGNSSSEFRTDFPKN